MVRSDRPRSSGVCGWLIGRRGQADGQCRCSVWPRSTVVMRQMTRSPVGQRYSSRSGSSTKFRLSKRPSALLPEVSGLGTSVLMPACSHCRISSPLKWPRSASAATSWCPVASRAAVGEQPHLAARLDELPASAADRLAVVLPKVGDRLEVRHRSTGEPDQLDVALGFPLQPPARLDAIEVAVDGDLRQRRRVVCRTARGRSWGLCEAWLGEIKFVDEGVDRPDWIVSRNPVLELLRKQYALRPLFPVDESARPLTPATGDNTASMCLRCGD